MKDIKVKKNGKKLIVTLKNGRKLEFRRTKKSEDGTWRYDSRDVAITSSWNTIDKTTKYGYVNSDLHRKAEAFIGLLPDSLANAIVPVERTSIDSDGEEQKAMVNIFVPDASEIFPCDEDNSFFAHPYKQLKYYKSQRNRIRFDASKDTRWYWTASAYSGAVAYAVLVYHNGKSSNSPVPVSYCAPVCFHVDPAKLQKCTKDKEHRNENRKKKSIENMRRNLSIL